MTLLKLADTPRKSSISHMIAIGAGKGGVGKSTFSVNLALSLKEKGYSVGLLDADVYGPSLAQMLPSEVLPKEHEEREEFIVPGYSFGIPFISVAHFKKEASIVRSPIANALIDRFLHSVAWPNLDYLLIDFPPGTGDIQLTLMQKAPLSGAIVITTPQTVATLDVRKAIQLFQRMEIPVLGVAENMSYFPGPEGKGPLFPFGKGGGESLSREFSIPLLGKIPIDSAISEAGDLGVSLFSHAPDSLGAKEFVALGARVEELLLALPSSLPRVRQRDSFHLEIEENGEWTPLSLRKIQDHCPCAACQEKGKKKGDREVSLLEFSLVGRYAIRIAFSSGCRQGIYPISLLNQLIGIAE